MGPRTRGVLLASPSNPTGWVMSRQGQEALLEQERRAFDTLRAARKWAKWLSSQKFATNVRIMRGGLGGEEVV